MKTWVIMLTSLGRGRKRPRRWLPRGMGDFYIRTAHTKLRFTFKCWKGIALTGRAVELTPGSPVMGEMQTWRFPDMKKRQSRVTEAGVKHLAPMESNVFRDHLALVEHCAIRQYDDGDAREPGYFTVKTQGGAWIVQIKDPDSCCSFSAVGDSLDKALDTAALLLGCDDAPWEQDGFLKAAQARKRK